MEKLELKPKQIIIAVDICLMNMGKEAALIIGKHYEIISLIGNYFTIQSEVAKLHKFHVNEFHEFFKFPRNETTN